MNESIEVIDEKIKELDKKIDDISYQMYGEPDYDDGPEQEEPLDEQLHWLEVVKKDYEKKKEHIVRQQDLKERIKQDNAKYSTVKQAYRKGKLKEDKESDEDRIERKLYANIIADYIMSKNTKVPFNIGVFGAWGEGKSSFINLIEKEIKNRNENLNKEYSLKTHVVKYDATEYSEKNKIWSCILMQLYKKFEEEKNILGRIQFCWNKCCNNLRDNKLKYIINIIIFAVSVFFCMKISKSLEGSKIKQALGYMALGIVPLIMSIVNIVIPGIKAQLKLSKPIADWVNRSLELPDYGKELGKKENIKSDLDELINVWLGNDERIIIFIDEIDRCSEKGIIELLEALQLFLKVDKLIIVLAIDFNVLSNKLYPQEKDNKKRVKLTLEYLEKYISLPIYLPKVNSYEKYIDFLLDKEQSSSDRSGSEIAFEEVKKIIDMPIQDNKDTFTIDEEKMIKSIINRISLTNNITPRTVKRLINMLSLSKQICFAICELRNYDKKILFEDYIKWFLFAYFNPEYAFLIEENARYKKYEIYMTTEEVYNDIVQNLDNSNKCSFLWLKEYVKEINVSELRMFREISRLFIISTKHISV